MDSVGSVEALEEEEAQGSSCNPTVLGRITVDRSTSWSQLSAALGHLFSSHLRILCGESQTAREEAQRSVLGLGPTSISSFLIGEETLLLFTLFLSHALSLFIRLLCPIGLLLIIVSLAEL